MNDQVRPQEQKDIQPAVAEGAIARSLGRRRFLGAGSAAAPFVLTLVSQPALGVTCFTPSRSLSRNTSLSQTEKNGDCTGISWGNYKTHQLSTGPGSSAYRWPISPSTKFHDFFVKGSSLLVTLFIKPGINPGTTDDMSMGEVLLKFDPGSGNLAPHIIGAYLNSVGGRIPANIITTGGIVKMWNDFVSSGAYFVNGEPWYEAEIVAYLKNNGMA